MNEKPLSEVEWKIVQDRREQEKMRPCENSPLSEAEWQIVQDRRARTKSEYENSPEGIKRKEEIEEKSRKWKIRDDARKENRIIIDNYFPNIWESIIQGEDKYDEMPYDFSTTILDFTRDGAKIFLIELVDYIREFHPQFKEEFIKIIREYKR